MYSKLHEYIAYKKLSHFIQFADSEHPVGA